MSILLAIAAAAFATTFAGGLFALRLKDKRHLVLGFSAGAVTAVAFFDLLLEAIQMGSRYYSSATLFAWAALGFLLYLVLDRLVLIHAATQSRSEDASKHESARGSFGAGSFSAHSVLDGVVIGLAFQASAAVGSIVTLGVLTHDFSDGINTMNVVLKNGGNRASALRWLLVNALAPAVGIGSTLFFALPEEAFSLALAMFGGFFLYIGASDLIPESHHAHPKTLTTVMTLLGAAVLYAAARIATR
jgi:ZIP family zinc transporter